MPSNTLANLLVSDRADSTVLTDDGITFGQFKSDISNAMASLSAQKKARVALFEPDTYRFMVWLFAAWQSRRIVLLPSEIETFNKAKFSDYILLGLFKDADLSEWGESKSLAQFEELDLDMEVLEVYTSGSTGEPTKITKKLWQLENEIQATEFTFGPSISVGRLFTGSASHQHFFGLPFRVLWPLSRGSRIARTLVAYPHEWDTSIPQIFVTSPSFLKRVAQTPDIKKQSNPDIITCFAAGGILDADLSKGIRALTANFPYEIYGSSETGHISYRQLPENIWQLQQGVEFKRPITETLEIKSQFLQDDDWFKTADMATDSDGSFEIHGRADTILKIEDKRISTSQINKAILSSSLVTESHILDLGNGSRDELSAIAVLNEAGLNLVKEQGKLAAITAIKQAMSTQVDLVGIPRKWRFLSALPRNSFGKITKAQCQELFSASIKSPAIIATTSGNDISTFLLEISDNLECLKGHFEKFPLVPGVAQLEWAIDIGLNHFGIEKRRFSSMEQVKFRDFLKPSQIIELEITRNAENNSLKFKYLQGDSIFSTGTIKFHKD
jgi:acyl-coenzyme A synthetase/AMP-(fatty) acid ligase/3-hydroxymyristoyl/3-hydroxydecanoyl-(acyl carrier protein) dehydratase